MKNITLNLSEKHENIDLLKNFGVSRSADDRVVGLLSAVNDGDSLYELIANPEHFAAQNNVVLDDNFTDSLLRTLDIKIDEHEKKYASPGGAVVVARVVAGAVLSAMVSKDLSIVEPDIADVGADDFV